MRLPRRGLLAVAGTLALLVATSCLSPTLPLPPPGEPEVVQLGHGQYALTGTIPEPGMVVALNERTALGYTQIAESSYRVVVAADPGDFFLVWYQVDLEASLSTRIRIPESGAPDGGAVPADAN